MLKEQLQTLYNVVITNEAFDRITLFGIGDKIIAKRKQKNLAAVQLEIDQFIESQISDLDKSDKVLLTTLLNNQINAIANNGMVTTDNSNISDTRIRLLGATVAKKILALRCIIGIQPMIHPVGQIFQLVCTCDDSSDSERSLRFEVLSVVVEAYTRQLQACWSLEAMQDLAFYSIDAEKEILSLMSTEITEEYTQQVIIELQTLAKYHEVITIKKDTDRELHGINFIRSLNQEANRIAAGTRRGIGNYIICHPASLSNIVQNVLYIKQGFEFSKTHLDAPDSWEFHHAGMITGVEQVKQYDVYVSAYMPTPENTDTILIGYKGVGDADTGYILAPYVPLLSRGIVVDNLTFLPTIKLSTRFGRYVYVNPIDGECVPSPFEPKQTPRLYDSTQYYRMIEIEHFDI